MTRRTLGVLAALFLATSAHAQDDVGAPPATSADIATADAVVAPTESVATTFSRAESAEQRGEVEVALSLYRRVRDLDSTSRFALRAERRLAWLEPRADDPEALGLLLRHRNTRERSLEDLARLERTADTLEPGALRRELRTTIATERDGLAAEASDVEASERAEEAYRRALDEEGLREGEHAQLVAGYAALLGREGRTGEALLLLDDEGHATGGLRARLELERIDAWARPLAFSVLGLLAISAIALLISVLRSGARLVEGRDVAIRAGTIAYVTLGLWALGAWYSVEAGHLAGSLATWLLGVLALSAVIGRCRELVPSSARTGAALTALAVLAPFAAGYLSIYGVGDGPLTH